MEEIEDYSDSRLKGWCVHCGESITTNKTSWDHVPTKGLLDRPLPAHMPQVEICSACNNGFSLDEQYFVTFLSCVLAGTTMPEEQLNDKISRGLQRNPRLRQRLEASRTEQMDLFRETRVEWQPERDRINRVVIKNARGHAYYEFGEPMLEEPSSALAVPLLLLTDAQREDFESVGGGGWPEVGSRMMTRVLTGHDLAGGWVVVQEGIYRYAVYQEDVMVVKSVIREYLATEVRWSD